MKPSWITISPTTGQNNGSLSVTATTNSGNARAGIVTVSRGGVTKTFDVSQNKYSTPIEIIVNQIIFVRDTVTSETVPVSWSNRLITLNDGSKAPAIDIGTINLKSDKDFVLSILCSNKGLVGGSQGTIAESISSEFVNEVVGDSYLWFRATQGVFTETVIGIAGTSVYANSTNSIITPMIFTIIYDNRPVGYIYCRLSVSHN